MNKWISRLVVLNVCVVLLVSSFGFQFIYFIMLDRGVYNHGKNLISPIMIKDETNPQSHIAESIRKTEADGTYQYYTMNRLPQNVMNELQILFNKNILNRDLIQYLLDGETFVEVNEGNYSYSYSISVLQFQETVGRISITTEKSTGKIIFLVIISEQIEKTKYNRDNYEQLVKIAQHISDQIQKLEAKEEYLKEYIRYLGLATTKDWVKDNDDFVSEELDLRIGQMKGEEAFLLFTESTLAKNSTEHDQLLEGTENPETEDFEMNSQVDSQETMEID